MEDMGAGHCLELVVLVSNGFSTHATVKFHFFNAFMKLYHMVAKLSLLSLCAIDPFTQAVNLQQAELYREERKEKGTNTPGSLRNNNSKNKLAESTWHGKLESGR